MLAALERFTQIDAAGGWPLLPPGPTMAPGSVDSRVPLVVKRLIAAGDLASNVQSDSVFDDAVEAAVMRFQVRHGLEPDGLVGKKTLRAMNVPAAERVAQLRINLERISKVFRADRADFLLVNVPAYEIYLVRSGAIVWDEKVIVGESETETPLFESAISHIVFNPTWTVPRKIAVEELLPRFTDDPSFFSRRGYDIVNAEGKSIEPSTIDWVNVQRGSFPYTLVQAPGPMNELGRIKFLFPNEFGVCMHDTPSRYLFANASRAFSHGCIRIAEPLDAAELLLEEHGWTRDTIENQINSGETLTIALSDPVPLVVAYLTARVGEDGTVYLYRDVYGLDVATGSVRSN